MASVLAVSFAFKVADFTVEILPTRIADGIREGYAPALSVLTAAVLFASVSRIGDLLRMIDRLNCPG